MIKKAPFQKKGALKKARYQPCSLKKLSLKRRITVRRRRALKQMPSRTELRSHVPMYTHRRLSPRPALFGCSPQGTLSIKVIATIIMPGMMTVKQERGNARGKTLFLLEKSKRVFPLDPLSEKENLFGGQRIHTFLSRAKSGRTAPRFRVQRCSSRKEETQGENSFSFRKKQKSFPP